MGSGVDPGRRGQLTVRRVHLIRMGEQRTARDQPVSLLSGSQYLVEMVGEAQGECNDHEGRVRLT